MKTTLKTLAVLISLSLISLATQAQVQKVLRLNLAKGAHYEMSMQSNNIIDTEMKGQKMKMDMKMGFAISYHVDDVLPNSNMLVTYGYKSMKMEMNGMGQAMTYDSDKPGKSDSAFRVLADLFKMKLKMEVTPLGKVVKVEGLEEYQKILSQSPLVAKSLNMFNSEDAFKSNFSQTFNYFPENAVKEGDSWKAAYKMPELMNLDMAFNFKVMKINKETIDLNLNGDVNMNTPIDQMGVSMNISMTGTQKGTMEIGADDGMVRNSQISQQFNAQIKFKNPQSGEEMVIPMVVNSVSDIKTFKI
ncbi:MAG: DUF6263 family protein [Bacteroidota bacterium]|nr:DUF6263 family protein [Bacteroidota bacterium]